jgi:hypothetical protein
LIERIKYIDALRVADLPPDQFTVVNSAWLALMDIRANGDLDIVISSELWRERFGEIPENRSFGIPEARENRLRVHAQLGPYVRLDDVAGTDDLVRWHSIVLDGIRFVEPRLYFQYKAIRMTNVQERINALPAWRRWPFAAGRHAGLFRKEAKDVADFRRLKKYFNAGEQRSGAMADIPESAWGFDDPLFAKFLRDGDEC